MDHEAALDAVLHEFVESGRIDRRTARDIMIRMYGLVSGEGSFGGDDDDGPGMGNVIDGNFLGV